MCVYKIPMCVRIRYRCVCVCMYIYIRYRGAGSVGLVIVGIGQVFVRVLDVLLLLVLLLLLPVVPLSPRGGVLVGGVASLSSLAADLRVSCRSVIWRHAARPVAVLDLRFRGHACRQISAAEGDLREGLLLRVCLLCLLCRSEVRAITRLKLGDRLVLKRAKSPCSMRCGHTVIYMIYK